MEKPSISYRASDHDGGNTDALKNRLEHEAVGAAAGFFFQLERALYWLAETASADTVVGVETLADIYIASGDGRDIHEEDKHSCKSRGRSSVTEIRACGVRWRSGVMRPRMARLWRQRARLLLVSNRPVRTKLARQIHDANDDIAVNACIAYMHRVSVAGSKTSRKPMRRVLNYGDQLLADVIKRVEINDSSEDMTGPALRRHIIDRLHLPESVHGDSVVDQLAGWLHRILLERWRNRKPG